MIGDLHGSFIPFTKILVEAGISTTSEPCRWTAKQNIILVQLGDLTDRGEKALECSKCLESLQNTVTGGSRVVRLLGNHDIWWLEGIYDYTDE